jgi:hypothetical protein
VALTPTEMARTGYAAVSLGGRWSMTAVGFLSPHFAWTNRCSGMSLGHPMSDGMPRHWRYLVAALCGLGAGAISGSTAGLIIGVLVSLTIILIIESRARRSRR